MPTGIVNAPAGLNLRQSGSKDAPILAKLPKDTAVDVLAGQGSDWLQVRVQSTGQIGFAFAQFITISANGTSGGGTSGGGTSGGGIGGGELGVIVAPGFLVGDASLMTVPLTPPQQLQALPDGTGVALARTFNTFGGLIATLSVRLNIPASVIVAVLVAESGGRTGDASGRMIVRFENHVFWNYWGKANAEIFNRFFRFNQTGQTWQGHQFRATENEPFAEFHGNQDAEWRALTFARGLNDTSALFSISMGMPQVMGFNYKRLGYGSVQNMFTAFTSSPRAQLIAIFDFVNGTSALAALQAGDFLTFARFYNGPGQAQNYANIIMTYKDRFDRLPRL